MFAERGQVMAGNWIKMGVGLRTHPKVVRMASALKADRLRVIGALHAVWSIFDAHTEEGFLDGYTHQAIDDDLGWKGFSKAMQDVGWLHLDDAGAHVPGYSEHNGATAKRRAMEASRKGSVRKKSAIHAPSSPQNGGTQSGQASASDADKMRNREEKRREDLNPPANTTPATGSSIEPEHPPAGVAPQDSKPDPKVVATVAALRVGFPVGTDEHDHAAELWAALHANGCKGTASHPAVIEMARAGVTVEQLKRAITEARKTSDGALNPAYLAAIVDRLKAEKPSNGKAQAWATDDSATEAKARELGLWPAKPGEDYHGLRSRIRTAIAKRAEESVR